MTASLVDPADLGRDAKALEALARFRLDAVGDPFGTAFDEAFGALEGEFGARGELERKRVIEQWIEDSPRDIRESRAESREPLPGTTPSGASVPSLSWQYHLLVARDERGMLAGARDCHIIIDRVKSIAVVYLAHVLVLPAYRRSGLGGILRAAPLMLARRATHSMKIASPEFLLAAEMEPADDSAPASLARLVAYGRSGFSAVRPDCLPYCQPDFRDPARIGASPRHLPLLALVKRMGHETEPDLPRDLARAFVRHLYAVFATHCRTEHLAGPRDHALAALEASTSARVPLLSLPRSPGDTEVLAPLSLAAILPFQCPEVRDSAHRASET